MIYKNSFYQNRAEDTRVSCTKIAVTVTHALHPGSVVDIGCGSGALLRAFQEQGCNIIFGVEGPWLDPASLVIPRKQFQHADLQKPLNLGKRFDVACSLEVAEHLPAACANVLIETLVQLSPCIIFSAAIPGQGGLHHVHERWPSYWARLFREKGYVAVDFLRPRLWTNKDIYWWYRQNTICFWDQTLKLPDELIPCLTADLEKLDLVHPENYLAKLKHFYPGVPKLLRRFPSAIWEACARRIFFKKLQNLFRSW
jgi:SAM-dependent methyltransferase